MVLIITTTIAIIITIIAIIIIITVVVMNIVTIMNLLITIGSSAPKLCKPVGCSGFTEPWFRI